MGDTDFTRNPRKKVVHVYFQLASAGKLSPQGFHHTMENACIEGIFQDHTIPLARHSGRSHHDFKCTVHRQLCFRVPG